MLRNIKLKKIIMYVGPEISIVLQESRHLVYPGIRETWFHAYLLPVKQTKKDTQNK